MSVTAVTDQTFVTEVLESSKPVVVDFWAEWCQPCRMVSPVLEELSRQHGDKIKFVKLNVDENIQTATQYRVTSIPTLNVYSGGRVAKQIIGARPKAAILAELREYL